MNQRAGGHQEVSIQKPTHLCGRVELQEPPAEGGGGGKVLELEEDEHGGAQGQRLVHRLQPRVSEVCCQLSHSVGVVLELLARQFQAQRYIVLSVCSTAHQQELECKITDAKQVLTQALSQGLVLPPTSRGN